MSSENSLIRHGKNLKLALSNTRANTLFRIKTQTQTGNRFTAKTSIPNDAFHFETLDKSYRYACLIRTLITQILMFTLFILLNYYLGDQFPSISQFELSYGQTELFFWALFLISLTWTLHSWFWVSVGGYVLYHESLLYHSGIIWQNEVILQFSQVSEITLSQSTIESIFGLGRIHIKTANKLSVIHIPLLCDAYCLHIEGIKYETALKIQRLISS